MNITAIGPWVLLALGALTLLAAIRIALKQAAVKNVLVSSVFGMALAGIGVYGPTFLDPYGDFLKVVFDAMGSPSETTYAAVVDQIVSEDVPAEVRQLGLSFMLDNPIEGMDGLLADGAAKAKDPDSRQALSSARETLEVRSIVAAAALRPQPAMVAPGAPQPGAQRFDAAVQKELARPLLSQPDSVLRRYHIQRSDLKKMGALQPSGH